MCPHHSLSQFLSMPFTLPLIGHLSHAWFHLIKPGWLQGENGGRKVGRGDFLLGDLLTRISCHNLHDCSGQSMWPFVLIYLCSVCSVNLIHTCSIYRFFHFSSIPYRGLQKNIQVIYFHISNWGILFSHLLRIASPCIQPLRSPSSDWAEEVIKQDAKPSLSDSRDTDLLFLMSDGGFYLPDKCQKYHSPSAITLAAQPTFPPLSLPSLPPTPDCERRSSKQHACNTAAISQIVIKEGAHSSPKS